MAYAAYLELFGANSARPSHTEISQAAALVVLDVTVPSLHAHEVRMLLAAYGNACVLRCIPHLQGKLVRLEIQLPTAIVDDVMRAVMSSIPSGEMGALTSWKAYSSAGLTGSHHGF